ncbi:hypothetical protein NC651_022369 [Populus alba x Populus x berolinensis]|uniref:PB1 domain-containing protein n=1 Tax=Populus davidiana TaxID=266767 RepID=A0A6M2F0N2_9ROSI|nr:hypothetical protein NC651_022369 [Populus alba x Populus x berolinensis]
MDNTYSFNSYPDSGDSSPRSREIDFDNPTPWEDQSQQPQSYKAKFMCSYGGKIHPRPHDNQLVYMGGETKILAADRNIKFSVMISKLSALCGDTDVAFKYQLPGEDLDALISVTNDDDLEHMMHEYDRLYRASAKPARMRLFLFPVNPSPASFGSDGGRSDRERFVEALNSVPSQVVEATKTAANNVDFLFGLDKGAPPPPLPVKVPDLPEIHAGSGRDDRVIGSDPMNLQAQLQRMQIREPEQQVGYNRKNSDENLVGGYAAAGSDYYMQKLPERAPPANLPVTMPQQVTASPGYWSEKQAAGGGFPAGMTVTTSPGQMEQPVYVIQGPSPGTVYHAPPVMRQVTGQTGQGYYMQRMGGPGHGPDVYREQPVYNMVPQHQQPPPPMGPMGVVRPSGPGVAMPDSGYAQMAYDSTVGRQVYYAAAGGAVHQQQQQQLQPPLQYQGVGGGVAVSGEMRHGGGGGPLGPEAKVVTAKVPQASV